MKKFVRNILSLCGMLILTGIFGINAEAREETTILPGIYLQNMDLSGKTEEEAEAVAEDYVEGLLQKNITLNMVNDNSVTITPGDIGFYWSNPEVIEEAASIGRKGNIIERYKVKKDLQSERRILPLSFGVDQDLIRHVLEDQCAVYNIEAENATLSIENGEFVIHQGQTGMVVDEDASFQQLCSFFTDGTWNGEETSIDLVVEVEEPKGSAEELSKVKDVLGSFQTSFKTSGASRSANVRNGASLINGTTLYPGEEFSTYEAVAPFSEANGYYMAGSYLNGQVVDSLGGGICQVSTTLYNAVLLSELEVTQRSNHSMIISYVKPSMDAAIAESSGKDFKFVNNLDYPIYIEGYTGGKQITFVIYGVETRDPGHKVKYESEVLSTTEPDSEKIIADSSQGIGFVSVQSAHIGYKAQLWKIVEENGVEVSREVINTSSYKMTPRTATVGVKTDNAVYASRIQAAIASGSIDTVKAEAAAIKAETAAAAAMTPEQQAAAQQQAALEAYYKALQEQQAAQQSTTTTP